MKKFLLTILGILMLTILYIIADIAIAAGVFKDIRPHYSGTERILSIPGSGPEDIAFDSVSGMAFISVDDRRANLARPGSVPGGILVFDTMADTISFRNVTPAGFNDLHPHGLSVWRSPEGRVLLFVVNHLQQPAGHAIDRFEWRNDSLVHLERITDPALMTSPNDVVAVGERSFYVSNDHRYPNPGLSRTLEDYLQRAISYVNYYDGKAFRTVASGIAYANGVNRSADGRWLYVAATTGRKLITYQIDPLDGSLEMESETDLATGVDNIEVDAAGDLWIGCHPQLLKFVAHAADPAKRSPSQVLRLRPKATGGYDVTELYLNDGQSYSGSTVAVPVGRRMFVGSVFEPGILVCQTGQ